MNKLRLIILLAAVYCLPLCLNAQISSGSNQFKQAQTLFEQKQYAAAAPLLRAVLNQKPSTAEKQEAEYMLACTAYELQDVRRIETLKAYLKDYPDSPHANRVRALTGSAYFFEKNYDEALRYFEKVDPDKLVDSERDDTVYRLAVSYMSTGSSEQAGAWFDVLSQYSKTYAKDASYYLGYIRYSQGRYDEALTYLLPLQGDEKYSTLVPYYIAECYLYKRHYDKAEIVAQNFLSAHPNDPNAGELYRVLGEVNYSYGRYDAAVPMFERYEASADPVRREASYMLGMSYYNTAVYSKAASTLIHAATADDVLTQNAYLHIGLAYLQLAEKDKARMAFQQAAASNANIQLKEQAAYNYALTVHETSYFAFGESVGAFERFLNEFPDSEYTGKVSSYLAEVYFNTKNYDAALSSIERIARPNDRIMQAKQQILYKLGTQSVVNADYNGAISFFDRSIAIGQYDANIKAETYYWRAEAYSRMSESDKARSDYRSYLQLTTDRGNEMYALAHYNLGYIAFNKRDYESAGSLFTQYIQLTNRSNKSALADAYNRVGDCHLNVRDFNEANRYYALAESLDTPLSDYALFQIASVSGIQKDYAGKVTQLNRLIGRYPQSLQIPEALYEKGRAYVQMENNTQAIASFSELADKYPSNALSRKAMAEIGLLYYQDQQYEKAIAAYRKVIENYPGSEEAHLALNDLKSLYIDRNRVDEFVTLTASLPGNLALKADEQDSLTYVAAETTFMRGKPDEAKVSFEKYLGSFPEGAFKINSYYYLTKIGYEQRQYSSMLEYSALLLQFPGNPYTEEVLTMRSEVLFNAQMYADALTAYRQLYDQASSADVRILAATGMLRSSYISFNNASTIESATLLLNENKVSPEVVQEALYFRARAYINQNESNMALPDLKKLSEDTRSSYGAEAKYLVGREYYELKRYADAEKELLDFIEKSTPHTYWLARGFVLLSDTYQAMGKTVEAKQYLLSLRQNYQADDDIKDMVDARLSKMQ